jgi:hypothetical protein
MGAERSCDVLASLESQMSRQSMVHLDVELPEDLVRLSLPEGVDRRLTALHRVALADSSPLAGAGDLEAAARTRVFETRTRPFVRRG